MKELWEKIKTWIKTNHPSMLATLNDGATEQDFLKFETSTGLKLPKDLKDFFSIHNGQSWTNLTLFDGDRLLSIDEIINDWESWKLVLPEIEANCQDMLGVSAMSEPEPGIKNDWWNLSWVPITSDGCGDSYCLDLDPDSLGQSGQIIRMYHDHPRRELLAPSFRSWINQYVNDLEKGLYIASNDAGWGGIVSKERIV